MPYGQSKLVGPASYVNRSIDFGTLQPTHDGHGGVTIPKNISAGMKSKKSIRK